MEEPPVVQRDKCLLFLGHLPDWDIDLDQSLVVSLLMNG
jgi:hypothetical protein